MPPPPSDTLAMPPVASRKRRRRPRPPSSPSRRSTSLLALAAVTSLLLHTPLPSLLPSVLLIPPHLAAAKEITATREWQLLSENDTLPAGLHVRMDLSTGERWAKLPDGGARDADVGAAIQDGDDDGGDDNNVGEGEKAGRTEAVEVDAASGAVSVVEAAANSGGGPGGGKKSAANRGDNNDKNSGNNNGGAPSHRDYDMMHRVMSRLPPDELARFGGLPALPSVDAAAPSAHQPTGSLTGAPRDAWEQQMERLWQARQAALAKAQENIADLPSVLRERIATIEAYLGDATGGLANILEGRKRADDNGRNDSSEEEENGVANDVLSALRDLAFQLSDVDLARDFRTLGGWAPLVSLLDEEAHLTAADTTDELQTIADEVRALAAATIGTAVGNVGEFRPWALAAVTATEEGKKAASALSLLVSSFQRELSQRSESMGDNTVAVASGSADRQTARATYKLRAAYALGALLRGNPAAQRYFVAAGGAETLARDALGTVSAVRGPAIDASLTKLDWRFASKALALGEDVVADVALHRENYLDGGGDERMEAAESAESAAMTAGQLVAAFATERWCDLSLRMLAPPTDVLGGAAARSIQERALGAVRQLAPGCLERAARAGDERPWGADEVRTVRAGWEREGDDDGADAGYRGELLALADAVLEGLQQQ